jgi:hypothetical protein
MLLRNYIHIFADRHMCEALDLRDYKTLDTRNFEALIAQSIQYNADFALIIYAVRDKGSGFFSAVGAKSHFKTHRQTINMRKVMCSTFNIA